MSFPSTLDPALYKSHTTTRGYVYSYYFNPPSSPVTPKPFLVFLHGFPSTSNDWRNQVSYFQPKGYGLLIPDMLGYGGTSKPSEAKAYVGSGLAQDIVDLMDAEGIERAVLIGHDWGGYAASRLSNYFPNRFIAFAFLSVYFPPYPDTTFEQLDNTLTQTFGRELFGYMKWFAQDETAGVIESKFDSFYNLLFPFDPKTWQYNLGPSGASQVWVESNTRTPLPKWATLEDAKYTKDVLLKGGMVGPLNWYTVFVTNLAMVDDQQISQSDYEIAQPVFYGTGSQDRICLAAEFEPVLKQYVKGDLITVEFGGDHWSLISHAAEVNEALGRWIERLDVTA